MNALSHLLLCFLAVGVLPAVARAQDPVVPSPSEAGLTVPAPSPEPAPSSPSAEATPVAAEATPATAESTPAAPPEPEPQRETVV
ncbi:MAG: hypothetical protein L0Y66_21485, partial [Myxococcaceae bacterium]|nr:hypothetical protein [Myxococcaceae bacterium]